MARTISGYVRSRQTGGGISGRTITIRDDVGGIAIPAGGMYGAGTNPVTTDANGFFTWSTELSPGPLRAEADVVSGVELKINSGQELMQAGDAFISDFPHMFRLFRNGIMWNVGSMFAVTPVTGQRQVSVAPGAANLMGRYFSTDTPRVLTVSPNTTLATRIDRVVLEQHVGGAYRGRQNIGIVQGIADGVVPATNADPNIFQFPIANITIPLNASSVTVADARIFAEPSFITLGNGVVNQNNLSSELQSWIGTQWPGFTVKEDGANKALSVKNLNFGAGFNVGEDVAGQAGITLEERRPTIANGGVAFPERVNVLDFEGADFTVGHVGGGYYQIYANMPTPPTVYPPIRLRARNDTDIATSSSMTLLSTSFTPVAGATYSLFAIGVARITDTSSSASPRGWLAIHRNGGEIGAEHYYFPGNYSGNGGSVQVLADDQFTAPNTNQQTFTLYLSLDQGVHTFNQRQILVWLQRIS